jgi:hypothetical protein
MRCKVHVILHPESIKFLQLCNASTGLNDLNCVEGSSSQVIRVWHVMELSSDVHYTNLRNLRLRHKFHNSAVCYSRWTVRYPYFGIKA